VFGYQRRTEALLDHLGQRWRFNGNVNILAGADLAGRTVDPGEMVSYLSGSFQSIYVRDSEELRRRLDRLDERRDPDGRFRVNDFFCYEGTWRETLEALLWRSDAVLMDLRGFTEGNSGCIFELEKLVERRSWPLRIDRTERNRRFVSPRCRSIPVASCRVF
jgi:hypothetical protein